jgi:hypothetical protein
MVVNPDGRPIRVATSEGFPVEGHSVEIRAGGQSLKDEEAEEATAQPAVTQVTYPTPEVAGPQLARTPEVRSVDMAAASLLARASGSDSEGSYLAKAATIEVNESSELTPQQVTDILRDSLQAIMSAVTIFSSEQIESTKIVEGIDTLQEAIWKIVLVVIPEGDDKKKARKAKVVWDERFTHLKEVEPEITTGIKDFIDTGNPDSLGLALTAMFNFTAKTAADLLPKAGKYIDGIEDLVLGVVNSWAKFKEGDPAGGVQAIWTGGTKAIELLIPGAADNEIYKGIIKGLDPIIANLNNIVDEYKTAIETSKICYKLTKTMQNSEPTVCPDSYTLEGKHCIPPDQSGADCWKPCGKKAGVCPEFCGTKVCCRKGFKEQPCECQGASGFTVKRNQKGDAYDYHQCVDAGNMVSSDSGRSLFELADKANGSQLEDLLTKKNRGTPKCVPRRAAALVDSATLKKNTGGEYGSIPATCGGAFTRSCNSMCYKPCPSGYLDSGACGCTQPCGGNFSASSGGTPTMCAQSPGLLEAWLMQTISGAFVQALSLWSLIDAFIEKPEDETAEKETAENETAENETASFPSDVLTNTIDSFVQWGKQFAHGKCPEN